MQDSNNGWAWFGDAGSDDAGRYLELALCFARCFRSADGELVLQHLRAMSTERILGPGASDALLRHVEGQRQLVSHIYALIERGRGNIGPG